MAKVFNYFGATFVYFLDPDPTIFIMIVIPTTNYFLQPKKVIEIK